MLDITGISFVSIGERYSTKEKLTHASYDELKDCVLKLSQKDRAISEVFAEFERRGGFFVLPDGTPLDRNSKLYQFLLTLKNEAIQVKAFNFLTSQVRFRGDFILFYKMAEIMAAESYQVGIKEKQPAAISPQGSYLLQSKIKQTTLNYLQFLLDEKSNEC